MAAIVRPVSSCIMATFSAISPVAFDVFSASLRTSSATTANPLPCSPARAASMAAFSARRFVWSAMSSITVTISPISDERMPSPSMVSDIDSMLFTSPRIPSTDSSTITFPSRAISAACRVASEASEVFLATSMMLWDISLEDVTT